MDLKKFIKHSYRYNGEFSKSILYHIEKHLQVITYGIQRMNNEKKYDFDKGLHLVKEVGQVEKCAYFEKTLEEKKKNNLTFGRAELELLTTVLLLHNVQHPAAIANMEVMEFEAAEETVVDGKKI